MSRPPTDVVVQMSQAHGSHMGLWLQGHKLPRVHPVWGKEQRLHTSRGGAGHILKRCCCSDPFRELCGDCGKVSQK